MNKDQEIDNLHFLSMECKEKLNEIVFQISKFILLSTVRELEQECCAADSKAHAPEKLLFDMKGDQISNLIKAMFDDGLVLAAEEKEAVLNYLFVKTQQNRAVTRLHNCASTFFKNIFDKYSGDQPTEVRRPRGDVIEKSKRTASKLKLRVFNLKKPKNSNTLMANARKCGQQLSRQGVNNFLDLKIKIKTPGELHSLTIASPFDIPHKQGRQLPTGPHDNADGKSEKLKSESPRSKRNKTKQTGK